MQLILEQPALQPVREKNKGGLLQRWLIDCRPLAEVPAGAREQQEGSAAPEAERDDRAEGLPDDDLQELPGSNLQIPLLPSISPDSKTTNDSIIRSCKNKSTLKVRF